MLLTLIAVRVTAKETITWMVVDWPPLMILEGDDKGKGLADVFLTLYQQNLPQYKHHNMMMNFARYWHGAKNGEPICNLLTLKNQGREDYMHFSIPAAMTLPNSIIMKQENIAKLGNPKSYSLAKLMVDKQFIGILESGRSYSQQIDVLLNEHQASSNLIRGVNSARQLIQMLELGRIEYIIEYPYIADYLRSQYTKQTQQFGSIGIDEIPPYYLTYVACPKTDWGKNVIDSVNQMLLKIRPTPEYHAANERWYVYPREIELIRHVYKTELLDSR